MAGWCIGGGVVIIYIFVYHLSLLNIIYSCLMFRHIDIYPQTNKLERLSAAMYEKFTIGLKENEVYSKQ